MNQTDISILKLSEAGRAALALIEELRANVEELGRMVDLGHSREAMKDEAFDTLRAQLAAAERSRDELGIQLAACQERLRLAMAVVDAARFAQAAGLCTSAAVEQMLRFLDAVPGDALSRDIGPALDRAHEASGVVTQKDGGE